MREYGRDGWGTLLNAESFFPTRNPHSELPIIAGMLHVLGIILLLSFCLLALVTLAFGIPGTFLIVGAALVYGWATGFAAVQWSTIGWLALLALTAEVIEFLAGAAAAAGHKPSRRVTVAVLAAGFIGGIVGAPFLFGIGALIGALIGAFAGAAAAVASEGGTVASAFTTGIAAMRGRLLGFAIKAAIAVVMIILLAAAAM